MCFFIHRLYPDPRKAATRLPGRPVVRLHHWEEPQNLWWISAASHVWWYMHDDIWYMWYIIYTIYGMISFHIIIMIEKEGEHFGQLHYEKSHQSLLQSPLCIKAPSGCFFNRDAASFLRSNGSSKSSCTPKSWEVAGFGLPNEAWCCDVHLWLGIWSSLKSDVRKSCWSQYLQPLHCMFRYE